MSKKETVISEIERLPEELMENLLEFINSLKNKLNYNSVETMIMSESSLKKDWLRPEEDEAWHDL